MKTEKLLRNISGNSVRFSIPKYLIKLVGSFEVAYILDQIMFWSGRAEKSDGWFYRSYSSWEDETLIQERTLRRHFKKLEDLNYIQTCVKKVNGKTVFHLRDNHTKIIQDLDLLFEKESEDESDLPIEIGQIVRPAIRTNCPDSYSDKMSDPSYTDKKKDKKKDNINPLISPFQGENKNPKTSSSSSSLSLEDLQEDNPHQIPIEALEDWITVRAKKRAPITKTAWKRLNTILIKIKSDMKINPVDAFEEMVANGWQSLKPEYFEKKSAYKPRDLHSTDDFWKEDPHAMLKKAFQKEIEQQEKGEIYDV